MAALAAALEHPLGYTVALGLPALRRGIAGLYRRWYGVDLNPERVDGDGRLLWRVPFGLLGAVSMRATGWAWASRVIPSYRQILRALSLTARWVWPTRVENRLQPVPADLEGVETAGADRGLTRQSDRHDAGPSRPLKALMDACGRAGDFLCLGRDLPRAALW